METIIPEISQSAIYEYNHYIQSQKEEGYGKQGNPKPIVILTNTGIRRGVDRLSTGKMLPFQSKLITRHSEIPLKPSKSSYR